LEEIESELVRNGRWEGKLVHTTREGRRVVVESRWSLELEGLSGRLVEINVASNNSEGHPNRTTLGERKEPQSSEPQSVTRLQQLEDIFELVNDSIMTRSMEGRISFWNHSAEELYGWRKEEVIGKVSHDLLKTQFPKPLEEIESELVRNGRWEGKLVHTTREGRRVVVESRWSLELEGQIGGLLEINACSDDTGRRANIRNPRARQVNDVLPKIASIVLAGGAFFCILVACYTFTRDFIDSTGKLLYGLVPIVLAGLLFASLKLKSSSRANLALFLVSLTASVYGMEFVLRSLDSAPTGWVMLALRRLNDRENEAARLSKEFGVQIDTRNPREIIADFNKDGVDIIPFVSPRSNLLVERDGHRESVIAVDGVEVLPLAGISNKLTLLCNENGQWVSYKSDAHGFNNPDTAIWKSAGVDIAALGDSFTQGYCVSPEKSFMGLIRQRYPMTLNLGIAGDGPLMMLATMREYLDEIKPKILLWFYCEDNDLVDLQVERKSELLTHYLERDFKQRLIAQQADIDDAMMKDIQRQKALETDNEIRRQQRTVTDKLKDKLVSIVKLSALRERLNLPFGTDSQELAALPDLEGPNLDVFAKILAEAKSWADASNGKMYFVYLPSWARSAKIPLQPSALSTAIKQRERVLSIVNSQQIPIVDISHVFDAQKDPLSLFPFRKAGHYNEIGHRLVAEEVIKHLSSQ
jgi:PAS domain S-box-containing protein